MNRVINQTEGTSKDILMILIGGIHGNELSGLKAIENVFKFLEEDNITVNGKLVGIAGNLQAIETKKRFIDYDLNRCWKPDKINEVFNKEESELKNEDLELRALFNLIDSYLEEEYEHTFIIDLHATSSDNGNFVIHSGIPTNNSSVLKALKLPIVINLDEYIEGTLLKYYNIPGVTSFAFEGGQIGSEKTIEIHTYGIWEFLYQCGLIPEQHSLGRILHYEELVRSIHNHNPDMLRVLYRHPVEPKDYFRMKPGFESFQPVTKGELLAVDKKGEIKAPLDGQVFMPLYQNTGEDGFFIVEEVLDHSH